MSVDDIGRLERVMSAGFETLADLQRETNARLDQTNVRLDQTNVRLGRVEVAVEALTERVNSIERVLETFAEQQVELTRAVRLLAENHEASMADLRRRVEAIEKRLGPEH